METIGLVEIILSYVLCINKLDLSGEIVEKKNLMDSKVPAITSFRYSHVQYNEPQLYVYFDFV